MLKNKGPVVGTGQSKRKAWCFDKILFDKILVLKREVLRFDKIILHFDKIILRFDKIILVLLSPSTKGVVCGAALRYHRLGWSVIPLHTPTPSGYSCRKPDCKNAGKHPCVPWSRLQQHQVSEEQIRAWWTRWPDANTGILTGAASGLVVREGEKC